MKIGLIAVGLNTYWHQFGGTVRAKGSTATGTP